MFSLHETTKIYLCRAAFIALCMVPTLAVLAHSVIVHLPGYARAHERAIAAALGLHAQLGKASSPRPGTMLYESLELSDPATREPLARLPRVEVHSIGSAVHVKLSHAVMINGARLDALAQAIRDAARPGLIKHSARLRAQNATVHLAEGDQSFTDIEGNIEATDDRATFKLSFRRTLAGGDLGEPSELAFVRQAETTTPTNVIQLTTGSTSLPCSLARSIWSGVECLGRGSDFQGRIIFSQQGGHTRTQASGRLAHVDLDVLVSSQFPHRLSGLGEIEFAQVTIDDGRVESAAGRIIAGPGAISRSLVQSALVHLQLQAASDAKLDANPLLPYRRLAFSFAVDSQGLKLEGDAGQSPGAMLIDDRGRVLVNGPAVANQPVVNLARALVPRAEVQIPATRETAALVRALPLPSIVEAGGQVPAGQARLPRANPKRK